MGRKGEKLYEYVSWLRKRVEQLGDDDYRPVLHIDVYGTLGMAFDYDLEAIADYLARLETAADPLQLRIEGPVDMGSKERQIEALYKLKLLLVVKGASVQIVADEWCNTLEDVRDFVEAGAAHMIQVKTPDLEASITLWKLLSMPRSGDGAYLGGTCNETDQSARVCVHVALASRPDQMLAKPGMGVDEE